MVHCIVRQRLGRPLSGQYVFNILLHVLVWLAQGLPYLVWCECRRVPCATKCDTTWVLDQLLVGKKFAVACVTAHCTVFHLGIEGNRISLHCWKLGGHVWRSRWRRFQKFQECLQSDPLRNFFFVFFLFFFKTQSTLQPNTRR